MSGYAWRRYNADIASLAAASVVETGNGFIYSLAPTLSFTLSGTDDKVYDAGTRSTATGGLRQTGVTGAVNGDTATVAMASGATGTFADAGAGIGKTVFHTGADAAVTVVDSNGKPVYGYGLTSITSAANITAATLTIAAEAKTKVYGQSDPTLTYTLSGLQGEDAAAAVLTGALGRASGRNVGSYAINLGSLAANANYAISYTQSALTITPATLAIAAEAKTKVYGQSDPTATYTVSGLQYDDGAAEVLTGALDRATGESVGSYAFGPGALTANANYAMSFTGNFLSITPASLTIRPRDQSRIAGNANPEPVPVYTGFRFGDTASVVSGLTISTAAGASSSPGAYALTPAGASASNYTITLLDGVLTVTAAPITFVPTTALGSTATGGSGTTVGFQNQGGGFLSSSSASFLAPASTSGTGTGGTFGSTSTAVGGSFGSTPVVVTRSSGGIISVQATPSSGAGGTGGQLESSISAGSFNVIYSQPVNYQVATGTGGAGGADAVGGGTGGRALAADSSFTTFAGDERPAVAVVGSGTSGDGTSGENRDNTNGN